MAITKVYFPIATNILPLNKIVQNSPLAITALLRRWMDNTWQLFSN